jgi:hypothetical protein
LQPNAPKPRWSRVTTVIPFAMAMAAIWPSRTGGVRPRRSASTVTRAQSDAAVASSGKILPLKRGSVSSVQASSTRRRRAPSGSRNTPRRSSYTTGAARKRRCPGTLSTQSTVCWSCLASRPEATLVSRTNTQSSRGGRPGSVLSSRSIFNPRSPRRRKARTISALVGAGWRACARICRCISSADNPSSAARMRRLRTIAGSRFLTVSAAMTFSNANHCCICSIAVNAAMLMDAIALLG